MNTSPNVSDPLPAPALANFDAIARRLAEREVALFLDYDGTLTPIVDRPEDATLSEPMRALLAALSARLTVAIVSGRDLANVRQMVALPDLVYAGSHGFDIAGPGELRLQHEGAQHQLPELAAAEQQLRARFAATPGVLVERKHFAIAIHYRLAAAADLPAITAVVDEVHKQHPALRKKGGKKIFELQPDVPWHKGHAVLWLRQALGLDRADVATIYIGDDDTDEDAFAALAADDLGLGLIVGPGDTATRAGFILLDCAEVQQFLQALLELVQRS